MFSEISSDCTFNIGLIEGRLERAESNNRKRAVAEQSFQSLCSAFNYLEDRLATTQYMLREIPIVLQDYKEERKKFIEDTISNNLALVFNEGYIANFSVKPFKNKTKAVLELWSLNEKGERELYIPSEQNGGLCRQVISASFGMAVAELLKCKMLFLDEAFNGGDSDKLQRAQLLLKNWIELGGTIVLNEHNPMLYADLPCTVYELEKRGKGHEGYVEILSVVEQEGSV